MLLLSIEYVPGKEIEALGLVKGTVVQSKNFGKDFMAGMKTLVGGEITGYTEMLIEARQIAVKRMVDRGDDCSEILTQIAAVRSAIQNAGKVLMMDHLNHCIVHAAEEKDYDKITEFGETIKKFMK